MCSLPADALRTNQPRNLVDELLAVFSCATDRYVGPGRGSWLVRSFLSPPRKFTLDYRTFKHSFVQGRPRTSGETH